MKIVAGFLSLALLSLLSCGKDGGAASNKPVAKFAVSGYHVPVPANITFINISENATSYFWNFGDGSNSTLSNPVHTYTAPGTYMLKLDVTGPGGTHSVCKFLTLEATPAANKSAFSYFQEKCVGTPVGISFKTINPASTNPVWDLGYGTLNLERDPIVQYLLPGDYTIKYSTQLGSIRDTVIRTIRID